MNWDFCSLFYYFFSIHSGSLSLVISLSSCHLTREFSHVRAKFISVLEINFFLLFIFLFRRALLYAKKYTHLLFCLERRARERDYEWFFMYCNTTISNNFLRNFFSYASVWHNFFSLWIYLWLITTHLSLLLWRLFFLFREKKFFDGDLKALHTRMRSNRGMAKFHCSQLDTKKFLINSQLRKNVSLASLMSLILRVMLRDAVLYVPSVKNITQIHALRETHDSARLAVSQTLEFTSGIFSQAKFMPLHSSSSSFDRFIYRVDT